MIRRLAHEPLGWRPTVLEVVVRRYRCADCGHVWRQDTSAAAEPRAKLSRTGLRWALEGIVVAHLTVARVAEGLGIAWDTANNAVLAEDKRLLINDFTRFEGVKVIGVDEHVWRHTRRGDEYVTPKVLTELTTLGRTLKKRAADVLAYLNRRLNSVHFSAQKPGSSSNDGCSSAPSAPSGREETSSPLSTPTPLIDYRRHKWSVSSP